LGVLFFSSLTFGRLLMNRPAWLGAAALVLGVSSWAMAVPTTLAGHPFVEVAFGPELPTYYGLASDAQGRIYIGNNNNDLPQLIPIQRFDPALFSGAPIATQGVGPALDDPDGVAVHNGFIYAGDEGVGLHRISVADGSETLLVPDVASNESGSPVVVRPSDGHIFAGAGGGDTTPDVFNLRIDEFDAAGNFVQSFITAPRLETMTIDPVSGLIYYSTSLPVGSIFEIRSLNPLTGADELVANSPYFILGSLTFDPLSGLLFTGSPNSGQVDTIDPATGVFTPFVGGFASGGFQGGVSGILREPVSGDLYVLDAGIPSLLFRLDAEFVFPQQEEPPDGDGAVPEPVTTASLSIAALALLAYSRRRSRRDEA
jgi:hypothetical protein